MKNKFTIAVALSILIAVGAPLISAFNIAQKFKDYPSIRVDIEPYDPRDLFYGRYMQFQISWNFKQPQAGQENPDYSQQNFCLCVGEGDVNPFVHVTECPPKGEKLPECRYTLRGQSWGITSFDNGVHRYYVDEQIAKPLEKLFLEENRKFALDLHITPEGESLPGMLYIDGVPLKEFIARNGGTIPNVKDPVTP